MFWSCMALAATKPIYAQIGLGTTTPDESSVVDISSRDKGMLTPRLTDTQRDAIASPATGLLIYNLTQNCLQVNTGTPSTPSWFCVGRESSLPVVVEDCNANGFEGVYLNGTSLTADNKFSVTITNQSFNSVDIAFGVNDLVLSGITGITVNSVTPPSVNLAPGASQLVEYELVGTPNSLGVLTGQWTKLGLNCTKEINISKGDANFNLPITTYVFSAIDAALGVDRQGLVDNGNDYGIGVYIPYSNASGSYDAYTSNWVYNDPLQGEGGDVDGFRLTYPAGSFASPEGYITATLEVKDNGSFNAKKQIIGVENLIASLNVELNGYQKGVVNLNVTGGIKDRNFDHPSSSYKFVYFPVPTRDGNVWLNSELGRNISDINASNFQPDFMVGRPINGNWSDTIYTSIFQWGRYSDGHEKITSSTTHSISNTESPLHDDFILGASDPGNTTFDDWLSPQNNSLWQGELGVNNPCPVGYRVPTYNEFLTVFDKEEMQFGIGELNSPRKLIFWGHTESRSGADGSSSGQSSIPRIWTNDASGVNAKMLYIINGTINYSDVRRSVGLPIRCIKTN